MDRRLTSFPLVLLLLVSVIAPGSVQPAASQQRIPVVNGGVGEETATAGYYTIAWSIDMESGDSSEPEFLLESAADSTFRNPSTVYDGPDLATTISGKPNGTYYYRVRVVGAEAAAANWSSTHKVTVAHHPLSRAFFFLAVGAIVFMAILAVVAVGHRNERLH